MKPPKVIRNAMRSFFGGKKSKSSIDTSQKMLEDLTSHKYSRTFPLSSSQKLARDKSWLSESAMSLSTKQRRENHSLRPGFEPLFEEGIKRRESATSEHPTDIRQTDRRGLPTPSSGSGNSFGKSTRNDNFTRRSVTSQSPFRSRHFELYSDYSSEEDPKDDLCSPPVAVQIQRGTRPDSNLKKINSDSNVCSGFSSVDDKVSARTGSSINFQTCQARSRNATRPSDVSEKLITCMDTLDRLSKKLDRASIVSSQTERLNSPKQMTPQSQQRSSQVQIILQTESVEWKVGNKKLHRSSQNERVRKRSRKSSDSGINSSSDDYRKNKNGSFSVHPPQEFPANFETDNFFPHKSIQPLQPRLRSKSSGYSSGSGDYHIQSHVSPINYYPQPHHPSSSQCSYGPHPSFYPNDVASGMSQYPTYGYVEEYGNEDPYCYGYASSSVYDEDLIQSKGWFYLPQAIYPPPRNPYAAQTEPFNGDHLFQPSHDVTVMNLQPWHERNPSFFPSYEATTPVMTSSQTSSFESIGRRQGASPDTGLSQKRKSVRFSQTVKERAESHQAKKKDAIALIKEEYSSPSSFRAAAHRSTNTVSQHTIYEFPTGHVETSCMCSNCILARGSSNLQPAVNYLHYQS